MTAMLTIHIIDSYVATLIRILALENILQSELKLAHRDGCRADDAEALTRGIGGCSRKYRTR